MNPSYHINRRDSGTMIFPPTPCHDDGRHLTAGGARDDGGKQNSKKPKILELLPGVHMQSFSFLVLKKRHATVYKNFFPESQ